MPRKPGQPAPNTPVQAPLMGLFLDHPPHLIPPTGFSACNNVRVYKNRVTSSLLGYTKLLGPFNGPITGGGIFVQSNGAQTLVIGTPTDIYVQGGGFILGVSLLGPSGPSLGSGTPIYITPIYTAGTASCSGTTVTGSGTAWNTPVGTGFRNNARAGDYIYFGSAGMQDPAVTWYQIQSVQSDTSLTLAQSAGTISSGAYTIRQCFSGNQADNHWTFETFPNAGAPDNADVFFMANGGGTNQASIDPIFKFVAGSGSGVLESGFSFTCARLRRWKNLMIYGDLLGVSGVNAGLALGTSIANSDNGLPSSLATGVAGQYVVGDAPFPITFLGVLGESLLMYMGDQQGGSIVSGQYVGLPTGIAFSTIIRSRGAIGSLVCEFPDRHEFIANDGQYRYNGLFIQTMNDHVWRDILTRIDYQRIPQAFACPAVGYGDLIWAIPLTSDPTQQLVTGYVEHFMEQAQNYLFKPYTQRDIPAWTCWLGTPGPAVFGAPVYASLVGDAQGNIYQLYSTDTQNGTAYTSTVTFAARIVAGERSRGLIKRIYPFAEVGGSYNLQVALAMQDRVGGPITLTDIQQFNLAAPLNRFTTHYRRGRVGAVTFSTPGPSQPWTLDGYDWSLPEGSPGGQR